ALRETAVVPRRVPIAPTPSDGRSLWLGRGLLRPSIRPAAPSSAWSSARRAVRRSFGHAEKCRRPLADLPGLLQFARAVVDVVRCLLDLHVMALRGRLEVVEHDVSRLVTRVDFAASAIEAHGETPPSIFPIRSNHRAFHR